MQDSSEIKEYQLALASAAAERLVQSEGQLLAHEVRPREAGGLFVQAARHLPLVRGVAHSGNCRLAGRSVIPKVPVRQWVLSFPIPLLGKIITRTLRRLTREGHLVEEEGVTYVSA